MVRIEERIEIDGADYLACVVGSEVENLPNICHKDHSFIITSWLQRRISPASSQAVFLNCHSL